MSGRNTAKAVVSDGASESAFAREWANALVEAFVAQPPELCGLTEESLNAWLATPREKWRSDVPWDRIPWHGETKARAGAFATLLGLIFGSAPDDPQRISWHALAVGDSCLFVVRGDRLCLSFPLDEASQFDNNPALICSNPDNAGELWQDVCRSSGECAAGDLLILATDALACWFLAQNAEGQEPWKTLLDLDPSRWQDPSRWVPWVGEQRRSGFMRNDDTTLVIIEVV